jgi:hypothetical protein
LCAGGEGTDRAAADFGGVDERILGIFGGADDDPAVDLNGGVGKERAVGLQLKRDGIGGIFDFKEDLAGVFLDEIFVGKFGVTASDGGGFGMKDYAEAGGAGVFAAHAKAGCGDVPVCSQRTWPRRNDARGECERIYITDGRRGCRVSVWRHVTLLQEGFVVAAWRNGLWRLE